MIFDPLTYHIGSLLRNALLLLIRALYYRAFGTTTVLIQSLKSVIDIVLKKTSDAAIHVKAIF
jgi:hypothetical protein